MQRHFATADEILRCAQNDIFLNLEDRFDFDRRAQRERVDSDGGSNADAGVAAENVGEQFAATVDDGRLLGKVGGAVDRAEDFYDAANAVERNNRAVPTLSEIGISKNLSSEA